jgi:hypothetical protein
MEAGIGGAGGDALTSWVFLSGGILQIIHDLEHLQWCSVYVIMHSKMG